MPSATQLVAMAASQIGVKESPSGSNKVKYWDAYAPHWNGSPWCDRFVSWCGYQIGASDIIGKYEYCPYHVSYFKKKGWWLDRSAKPQAGDIIFFANKGTACHVGIVEKRISASQVQTIEGNTSTTSNDNGGRVMRRTRGYGSVGSSWYILGFARPVYGSESSSATSTSSSDKGYDKTPDTVLEIQKYMNQVYGSGLAEDNDFGSKTKAAIVKEVQKIIGTKVDGDFGSKSKAAWGSRVVKSGSQGNLVRLCQMMLVCKGYEVGSAGCDGDCGSKTVAAIKKFQQAKGLTADSKLGRNTAAKLFD